jgi:hypothetical protein
MTFVKVKRRDRKKVAKLPPGFWHPDKPFVYVKTEEIRKKHKSARSSIEIMLDLCEKIMKKIDIKVDEGKTIKGDEMTMIKTLAPLLLEARQKELEKMKINQMNKEQLREDKKLRHFLKKEKVTEDIHVAVSEPINTFNAISQTRDETTVALQKNLRIMNSSKNSGEVKDAIDNVRKLTELLASSENKLVEAIDVELENENDANNV